MKHRAKAFYKREVEKKNNRQKHFGNTFSNYSPDFFLDFKTEARAGTCLGKSASQKVK